MRFQFLQILRLVGHIESRGLGLPHPQHDSHLTKNRRCCGVIFLFVELIAGEKPDKTLDISKFFRRVVVKSQHFFGAIILSLLLNIYWLLPASIFGFIIRGNESIFLAANVFTREDLFHLSSMGTVANVLRMRTNVFSYFHDRGVQAGLEAPIMSSLGFFEISVIAVVVPFLAIIVNPGSRRILFVTILGIVSIILALGSQGPFGIYLWMYDNVPFFVMFREPNKFVAVVALSYAFLTGYMVQHIFTSIKKWISPSKLTPST